MSQGHVPFLYCDLYKRVHSEKTIWAVITSVTDYSTNELIQSTTTRGIFYHIKWWEIPPSPWFAPPLPSAPYAVQLSPQCFALFRTDGWLTLSQQLNELIPLKIRISHYQFGFKFAFLCSHWSSCSHLYQVRGAQCAVQCTCAHG